MHFTPFVKIRLRNGTQNQVHNEIRDFETRVNSNMFANISEIRADAYIFVS